MNILPIQEIEQKVQAITHTLSEVHGYGHLKRTAIGAQYLARLFKASEEEQQIAYVAGLIHDLERPATEKIHHSDISVTEADAFLNNFSLNKELKDNILLLIQVHRHPQDIPLNQQWVYLSDKLLEQSGAYIIFRRCYYVGECEDFTEVSLHAGIVSHWQTRMKKFNPLVFPERVRDLSRYQYQWQEDFFKAFISGEAWATRLVTQFYEHGRKKDQAFESLIESFEPEGSEDRKIQQEAIEYMNGTKYPFFTSLVSQ